MKMLLLLALVSLAVAAPVKELRCPADIVYVVDQSSSVTSHVYFSQVVPFLANLTLALDVGTRDDHIAFVPFSTPDDTYVGFFLDYSYDRNRVVEKLQKYPYHGGSTATVSTLIHKRRSPISRISLTHITLDDCKNSKYNAHSFRALGAVRHVVLLAGEGARVNQYKTNTVAPIVLVVTDGLANDGDPTLISNELRSDGVKILVVGVGPDVTMKYLLKIAGSPENVFYIDNFAELDEALIEAITNSTKCESRKFL